MTDSSISQKNQQQGTSGDRPKENENARTSYEKPLLTSYGDVRSRTMGGSGTVIESGQPETGPFDFITGT